MLGLGAAKKLGLSNKIDPILIFIKEKTQELIYRRRVKYRNKQKIFIIGFNKTGTTTLQVALEEMDLIVGIQRHAEKRLLNGIINYRYKRLISYCKTAEAFQDVPFSFPNVYKILDKQFPNSKFILTIRDNPEQWYNSVSQFHSKLWGNGKLPTKNDLLNANYINKGWALKAINFVYGDNYYDKNIYIQEYNKHNIEVQEHFKQRPKDLLVLNVSNDKSYREFCNFIEQAPKRNSFQWENKTSDI